MTAAKRQSRLVPALVAAASAALLLGSWQKWVPLDLTESLGFVSGAVCVWLVTLGNIWNWPIGLANNIFFAVLFYRSRLFADLGLQAVYFAMGIYGWWHWLRGGERHSRLVVSHATRAEWICIVPFVVFGTWGLRAVLMVINGAAPLWDALTTILCLAAQYLLCQKRYQNWWLWIAADLIYVPLYFTRHLPLTAVLYAGFLGLCTLGLRQWKTELPRPE